MDDGSIDVDSRESLGRELKRYFNGKERGIRFAPDRMNRRGLIGGWEEGIVWTPLFFSDVLLLSPSSSTASQEGTFSQQRGGHEAVWSFWVGVRNGWKFTGGFNRDRVRMCRRWGIDSGHDSTKYLTKKVCRIRRLDMCDCDLGKVMWLMWTNEVPDNADGSFSLFSLVDSHTWSHT